MARTSRIETNTTNTTSKTRTTRTCQAPFERTNPHSGHGGRRFKSSHPDQEVRTLATVTSGLNRCTVHCTPTVSKGRQTETTGGNTHKKSGRTETVKSNVNRFHPFLRPQGPLVRRTTSCDFLERSNQSMLMLENFRPLTLQKGRFRLCAISPYRRCDR